MRVFVAKWYECVMGVYSTRELANANGEQQCLDYWGTSDAMRVEEWEVDGKEII